MSQMEIFPSNPPIATMGMSVRQETAVTIDAWLNLIKTSFVFNETSANVPEFYQ